MTPPHKCKQRGLHDCEQRGLHNCEQRGGHSSKKGTISVDSRRLGALRVNCRKLKASYLLATGVRPGIRQGLADINEGMLTPYLSCCTKYYARLLLMTMMMMMAMIWRKYKRRVKTGVSDVDYVFK